MKHNKRQMKIILSILIIGLFVFIPVLSESLEILLDGDKDGISDALEKYIQVSNSKYYLCQKVFPKLNNYSLAADF